MLRRVKKYISDNELLRTGAKVLVCVSGGADSVALLDVLLRSGYECHVAHCNFGLRGAESDRDEAFVRELCATLWNRLKVKGEWLKVSGTIPLYVAHFDTLSYAQAHKLSIETAARELRYTWFDELARQIGCEAVAVAHHQNDQAETILMNIRRGCGLQGLRGMQPKSKNPYGGEIPIIRPLLCTTHDYICHYLRDIRGIDWVEDSTNSDTSYKRNAVRAELANWSKAEIEHLATLGDRLTSLNSNPSVVRTATPRRAWPPATRVRATQTPCTCRYGVLSFNLLPLAEAPLERVAESKKPTKREKI